MVFWEDDVAARPQRNYFFMFRPKLKTFLIRVTTVIRVTRVVRIIRVVRSVVSFLDIEAEHRLPSTVDEYANTKHKAKQMLTAKL